MILPILLLGVASFILSWLLTLVMIRIAPRWGLVDHPGGRKIHENPKPLGGGVAIFWSFAMLLIAAISVANITSPPAKGTKTIEALHPAASDSHGQALWSTTQLSVPDRDMTQVALWEGARKQTPLALMFLGAMLGMHALGFLDDRKPLGPSVKLVVQLTAATALVLVAERMALSVPSSRLRVLTALDKLGLGIWPSTIVTVLWIVAITNAFNFLDNMDGLSAGVAAVCATAFLVATLSLPQPQWFVAATLALLLGSLLGFLWWNFPPAKIFMGDSGSLVIGFVLGVLTVRTTFLPPGVSLGAGWYAVFAPVIVMALPLYDLIVVSIIRLSRGKSPFVGDTNHFSHRLVARGMSRRTAVLCLYLITATTSIAAILLPHVQSSLAAILIFCQTLLILGVVALLEQHPLPPDDERVQ